MRIKFLNKIQTYLTKSKGDKKTEYTKNMPLSKNEIIELYLKEENNLITKEFDSRIQEIIFKDGSKEYFPQIKFNYKEDDEWLWIRYDDGFDFLTNRPWGPPTHALTQFWKEHLVETRKNDYLCACKTKEGAIKVIDVFRVQRQIVNKANIDFLEKEKKRRESIDKINIIGVS